MTLIHKIQKKSQKEKLAIIWTITIATGILLIIVWAISYKFHKTPEKDNSLFQTIGQGVEDVKKNYKK